jgi:hypothetical protein
MLLFALSLTLCAPLFFGNKSLCRGSNFGARVGALNWKFQAERGREEFLTKVVSSLGHFGKLWFRFKDVLKVVVQQKM